MSKLIIVCGLPGAGKTLLAENLSKNLGVACIHKDTIKEVLYDSLGYSTLEESKRIGKPSMEVLFALAQEQLSRGVDTIIESPFNYAEDYRRFLKWQEDYGIEIISVICEVDWQERKKRYRTRERHKAHHDHERSLDNVIQDYSSLPGKQIFVNTSESIEKLIRKILNEI